MNKLLAAVTVLAVSTAQADTIYVDDDAPLGGNGLSWETAFRFLQDALVTAALGDEIHVGQGIYKPDQDEAGNVMPGDRAAHFPILNGVSVMGGYAGYGHPEPNDRDADLYETTLSGDLLGNDTGLFGNYGDNAYNVIFMEDTLPPDGSATLDGFVVRGGNANGSGSQTWGAGLHFDSNNSTSQLAVANCRFVENTGLSVGAGAGLQRGIVDFVNCEFVCNVSADSGGGLWKHNTVVSVEACTFQANEAGDDGGGLYSNGGMISISECRFLDNVTLRTGGGVHIMSSGFASITGSTFERNTTLEPTFPSHGGGLYADTSQLELIDCSFVENTAAREGGGIYVDSSAFFPTVMIGCDIRGNEALTDGGGVSNHATEADVVINCLFSGNVAADSGGGLWLPTSSFDERTVANCTFANNSAASVGGLVAFGNTVVFNSVFWANLDDAGSGEGSQLVVSTDQVQYSCIEGWSGSFSGPGNHGNDPMFADPTGPDGTAGTEDDDLRLSPGSPCIDAANNIAVPAGITTDLDGNPRFVDDPDTPDTGVPGNGHIEVVDMGAYEFQGTSPDTCPWDCGGDNDGNTGITDFLALLAQWGGLGSCDFDGGGVGINDFLELLANWGPCP